MVTVKLQEAMPEREAPQVLLVIGYEAAGDATSVTSRAAVVPVFVSVKVWVLVTCSDALIGLMARVAADGAVMSTVRQPEAGSLSQLTRRVKGGADWEVWLTVKVQPVFASRLVPQVLAVSDSTAEGETEMATFLAAVPLVFDRVKFSG